MQTGIYFAVTFGLVGVTWLVRWLRDRNSHAWGFRGESGSFAKFGPVVYCVFVFVLVGLVKLGFEPPRTSPCKQVTTFLTPEPAAGTMPRASCDERDPVYAALAAALDDDREHHKPGWEARVASLQQELAIRRRLELASTPMINCGNYVEWEALVGLESAIALSIWFGAV